MSKSYPPGCAVCAKTENVIGCAFDDHKAGVRIAVVHLCEEHEAMFVNRDLNLNFFDKSDPSWAKKIESAMKESGVI